MIRPRLKSRSVAILTLGTVLVFTHAAPPSALPSDLKAEMVRGEVLKISAELYVIKDASGKTTLLQAGKDTHVEAGIKDGDMVQANLAADGHPLSISKTPAPDSQDHRSSMTTPKP